MILMILAEHVVERNTKSISALPYLKAVQIILENRITVLQREQKGVSLTTLIPHRSRPGLRTIP